MRVFEFGKFKSQIKNIFFSEIISTRDFPVKRSLNFEISSLLINYLCHVIDLEFSLGLDFFSLKLSHYFFAFLSFFSVLIFFSGNAFVSNRNSFSFRQFFFFFLNIFPLGFYSPMPFHIFLSPLFLLLCFAKFSSRLLKYY